MRATNQPINTITVHIGREPSHPSVPAMLIAVCGIGNKRYEARSYISPIFNLARHLAQIGIPDAALVVRTADGQTRYPSFFALAGGTAVPAR